MRGEEETHRSQADALRAPLSAARVSGMARYFVGESPMARFSQSFPDGQG